MSLDSYQLHNIFTTSDYYQIKSKRSLVHKGNLDTIAKARILFFSTITMERKKLFIAAAGAGMAVIGSVAAIVPLAVYAAETTTNPQDSFVQKLAEKLGIDATTVEDAVESAHEDMRAEMEAKREEEINQAVTDGKLTQRQADILLAIDDAMESLKTEAGTEPTVIQKEDLSDLSEEEREAKLEEFRAAHDQELVDALNEAGLNTTIEELQAAQDAARDADVGFGFSVKVDGPIGPGGHGFAKGNVMMFR